jgi:uncharacterized protein YaaR (DUF327 family)
MSEMTLSQALRQVKKIKGDLKERLDRAHSSVSYKEEAKPAFGFKQSLDQAELLREKLINFQTRITITNAQTRIEFDGKPLSMTQAVRTLEELKGRIKWFKELPVRAQVETKDDDWDYDDEGKRRRVQVRWKCDLPESERAATVEKLQDQFDRLNDAVEKANHSTVLAVG